MIFPNNRTLRSSRALRLIPVGKELFQLFVPRRPCVAVLHFLLLLLGICLLYLQQPLALVPPEDSRPVTLLVWSHPFGHRSALPDCLQLHGVPGCTLSDDRSSYPQADAVIVHHRDVATGTPLPAEPRPRAQKWIWMNYESPTNTPDLWSFEDVFNLTLTYRTDSHIFLPYGYLVPRAPGAGGALGGGAHRLRPRLLAWVISNWSESHARVAFYYQLRRYLPVDVFGRAGRPLPQERGVSGGRSGGRSGGGVVRLLGQYQFYLALENSQHTDYITEKLWNSVLAGAVPVVLGPPRKNYERFLPPEAFIHVDDFPTVRELARYLLMLRRSPVLLRHHLAWRGGYSVHQPTFWSEHYCAACRVVRRARGATSVVQHLERWFHS